MLLVARIRPPWAPVPGCCWWSGRASSAGAVLPGATNTIPEQAVGDTESCSPTLSRNRRRAVRGPLRQRHSPPPHVPPLRVWIFAAFERNPTSSASARTPCRIFAIIGENPTRDRVRRGLPNPWFATTRSESAGAGAEPGGRGGSRAESKEESGCGPGAGAGAPCRAHAQPRNAVRRGGAPPRRPGGGRQPGRSPFFCQRSRGSSTSSTIPSSIR